MSDKNKNNNVTFVPSDRVSESKMVYDPAQTVTIRADVDDLIAKKRNGEIDEQAFIDGVKAIVPTFDENIYKTGGHIYGKNIYAQVEAENAQKKALLDKKMQYINSLLPEGHTISNDGMGIKDFFKQAHYSRSVTFLGRKQKFMEDFPDGAYTQMSLPLYDDEKIEIFKKDKNDKNWNFRLPYGRDVGEFGVATGSIATMRTFLGGLSVFATKNPTGPLSILALMGADYTGQQLDKTIEQLSGYGELEYSGDAGVGTLFNYWNNLFERDMLESIGVGGAQVFLNRIINRFTKGDRSKFGLFGVNKNAQKFIDAYEELQKAGYKVDPIVWAQIASWPILRSTFFQAKDFVRYPKEVLGQQTSELYKQFQKFGLDLAGTGKGIKPNDLVKLVQDQEMHIGSLLQKSLRLNNKVEKDDIMNQILNATRVWDDLAVQKERYLAQEAGRLTNIEGLNFNISPVKNLIKRLERGWPVGVVKGPPLINLSKKQLKILEDAKIPYTSGTDLSKTQLKTLKEYKTSPDKMAGQYAFYPPSPVTVQKVPKKLRPIFNIINRLDDTLWRKTEKGGLKNWSNITDTIASLRSQLRPLLSHEDEHIRRSAREIWKTLKKQTKNVNGQSEEFKTVWNQFLKTLDNNDMIRNTMLMRKAIGASDLDASLFVSRFLDPSMPNSTPLLMRMLREIDVQAVAKGGQAKQLENVQKAFLHNMTNDPKQFSTKLNTWLDNNPEGLAIILGGGTDDLAVRKGTAQINELKAFQVIADKMDNSIVNQALQNSENFSMKEFVKFVEQKASAEGLGAKESLSTLIKDLGGIDSPGVDAIRSGIISNILKRSINKDLQRELYEASGETIIDPQMLNVALRDFDDNLLSNFFTKDHLDMIKNFRLYSTVISGMEDVGGPIAAGALRGQVAAIPTKPISGLLNVARTLLGYKIMSYLLGNKMTAAAIGKMEVPWYTQKGIAAMRNILAQHLAHATGDYRWGPAGEDMQKGTVFDFVPSDKVSQGEASIIKKVIESETGAYPGSEMDKVLQEQRDLEQGIDRSGPGFSMKDALQIGQANIPDGSRLGQTNIFNTPTYDRGKQLFTGRDEITFASKGGIMSTNKAFQRVA